MLEKMKYILRILIVVMLNILVIGVTLQQAERRPATTAFDSSAYREHYI